MATKRPTTATTSKTPTNSILSGLRSFGWGSGFRSPFANAENKALEDLLEKKQKSNLILRAEVEDTLVHTKDLEKHLIESGEDIKFTESLINSKKQECENEMALVRLAERILSHTKHEINKQRTELVAFKDRNGHQNALARRRKQVVDELTETVQLDMKLMKVYEAKKVEYEEEMKNVHIYDNIDKKHIHELEAKQVDLGARNKLLRHELDQCAMNSNKYQEQYTRLCAEFRKVYKQKKEMTSLWAKSLNAMKGRDSELQEIAEEFYEVRARIRQVKGVFDGRIAVLNQKHEDLIEADYKINALDRRLKDLREKLEISRKLLLTYKDEYSQLNIVIQNTTISIETYRRTKREMEAQVAAVVERLRIIEGVVELLRAKRDEVVGAGTNKGDFLDELDALIEYEEKVRAHKEREVEKIRMFAFTKANEKKKILREHQLRETRMLKCKSSLSIMQAKEFETMEQLARKQSKIYRSDLDVSQLEMRISRLMNHNIDPRFFVLQERLVKMREKDELLLAEHKEILKEMERVTDLTHAFDREIDNCIRERALLQAALFDINLNCERIEKGLVEAQTSIRFLRIGHSLEVVAKNRVQKNLTRYKNMIFSLTQHRATVEAAVKERKSEINFMKILLVKQHRELTKQIGTICTQRVDLYKYTDKLKGRYEITTSLMAPSAESDGTEFSFSAQVYKQVRERENLNMQRDNWEFRIDEATKELECLKNVLRVTTAANIAFRQSLKPATDKNNVADHVHENQKKAMVIRNRCKAGKARLRRETEALLKTLGVYQQDVRNATLIADEKERESSSLCVELQRQKDKIRHWESVLCRQLKVMSKTFNQPFVADLGKELKRRMILEKFKMAVTKLRSLVRNRPAISTFIDNYTANHEELVDVLSQITVAMTSISRRSDRSDASNPSKNISKAFKTRSAFGMERSEMSTMAIGHHHHRHSAIHRHSETEAHISRMAVRAVSKARLSFAPDVIDRTEIIPKIVEFQVPAPSVSPPPGNQGRTSAGSGGAASVPKGLRRKSSVAKPGK